VPVAEAPHASPTATGPLGAPGSRKVTVNIDFPTAASIPPVNIMNPEPKGPVLPGVAAAAATNPNPQTATTPPRRPKKQAATAPAQAVPGAPPTEPVDPVWMPTTPLPASPGAATVAPPAASSPPNAGAPVQLNPFPSPPEASAGGTVRAQ